MKEPDLFDDAGYDLRPMIRAAKKKRRRELLIDDNIYSMTLQEYVEWRELGMPYNELDDETAREKARLMDFSIHVINQYGNRTQRRWMLPKDAPIRHCYAVIQARLKQVIRDYEDNDGRYGKRGHLIYVRKVLQALEHGLEVPEEVLQQRIIQVNLKKGKK